MEAKIWLAVSLLAIAWGIYKGITEVVLICITYVVTYSAVRLLYWTNSMSFRLKILDSKADFLDAFAVHLCTLKDNASGIVISYMAETGIYTYKDRTHPERSKTSE